MAKMLSFKITEEDFLVTHSKNHRCKTIRIVHDLSGAYGENVVPLFQENDKQLALEALVYSNIFQSWLKKELKQHFNGLITCEQVSHNIMSPRFFKI